MALSPQTLTETLEGTVERIVYSNEENHYTVALLLPEGRGRTEPVTIVGNLASLNVGESLRTHGRWVNNKKFGRQFVVDRFDSILPRTVVGIRKYLGSGLVPGIGGKFAERIVAKFGERTFEVIDQSSAKLREVEGIGPERAKRIKDAWMQQKTVRDIMIFLQGHGIGSSHAAKIFKQYGENAIQVVRDNPYRLARDITGIGFKTADGIASKMGIVADSIHRLKAGVVHVLEESSADGHVCLPQDMLAESTAAMLHAELKSIENAINLLALGGDVQVEEGWVYLAGLYRCERGVAELVRTQCSAPVELPPIDIPKALEWVQGKTGVELAVAQQQAITRALQSKVSIITGGPGVGKTTIVNSIVKILHAKKSRVALAAPTGRAAKRMSEATGTPAQTIHRLLRYDAREGGFTANERQPLKSDMIIIDEASMLDIVLAYHLLKAIPTSSSLVFVGDVDQLPSVGPGNFLRDLIECGRVPVVRLTEIFRQAKNSLIITNAHRVNRGELPQSAVPGAESVTAGGTRSPSAFPPSDDVPPRARGDRAPPDRDQPVTPDFFFIEESDPEKVLSIIKTLCAERIPQKFRLDAMRDVQVLTPMHKGTCGAENLNRELQATLNPTGPQIDRYGRTYRVGDRVMQIRNNYDKDVFNGDLGRVQRIDLIDQQVNVDIDGRDIVYDFTELDELVPAYAISVHKSQGNEYPAVIVPVLTQHYVLLQRNLLYTAITRGKRLVILVGTKKALAIAVDNDKTASRFSRLCERLRR